ncbi:MAG: pentapeptide repeat-containing protein, partial [Nocardiopsaceae bacterium]|nr:pentapeptide repeat-containing protein [Nocardiopsaceae bacterium]
AEVIAALLLGAAPAEPGRTAALRLDGARVTGTLDLGHSQVTGPVRLRHCEFDSVIDLSGARTRDIDLEGSRLSGLAAPLAGIDGNLSLIGCECSGQVALTGAHVTGSLRMQEASLDHPGHAALLANRLVVDDDLIAAEAVVNGEMRLAGARVGGIVLLDRAVVHAAGARRAVNAFNMHVALDVLARSGFAADGEVAFSDVRVGQNLDLRGASFRNPGGNALRCRKTDARRLVISGVTADGMVDFRYSRFTVIRDEPPWPEQLRLSGVSYDRLEPVLPAARRVEWLRRDADGYLPENYETLASMYRGHGDDAAARTVLLARERERRRQLPWHARAWSLLQEITVGYGYRPLRAGAWLAAFCVLGTVAFGLHRPAPVPGAPHPAFNSLVYSLDLLVPLVDFGLRNGYDPHGPLRWLAYLCVAVGWIFATTIAAGIARVLRRQ